MMKNSFLKKFISIFLAVTVMFGAFASSGGLLIAEAAKPKVLTLAMAKKSGLANSPEYEKLESELAVKEVSLSQALKSIKIKKKNMATFRWTPLLSFKFPEKPNLSEAYEFQFKPIQIQSEIDTVKHKMVDQVQATYETISTLYVDIVVLIDTIKFNEERLEVTKETLAKNKVRLLLGEATQSDIDKMEKSVKSITDKIAKSKTNLENKKKKLSTKIGMDVSGYTFQNPMVEAELKRSQLADLTQYTLDRDQNYYEACMNVTTGLISLNTNYNLMSGQYGGKMSYISGFVNQAKSGQKVNGKSFKKKYEEFLKAIDKPWAGHIRILFIKIPKEWFKGQISGIRYVEDEPYALYEATLSYQDALLEKKNMKQSITEQVEDSFNNVISMRNSYMSLVEQVANAGEQLKADRALNLLGELTYDEYATSLEDYEGLQNDMFDALASYSQSLYSFDRLTCGGITYLLEGTGVTMTAGGGGVSNVEEEITEGAKYYIEPIIQEQEFRIGITIPDGFEIDITDFELWCDGIQIGERTEADKPIRHLALSTDNVDEVKIRLYNGDEFVDDCVIDPDVTSGPLDIVKGYNIPRENAVVGEYEMSANSVTGMVNITLKPDEDEGIGYYRIKTAEGKFLTGKEQIAIDKKFRYLSLMQKNIGELTIEFYDENSNMLYEGAFDIQKMKLIKKQTQEEV